MRARACRRAFELGLALTACRAPRKDHDPARNEWRRHADRPGGDPLGVPLGATWTGRRLLVGSGLFDPADDRWTSLAEFPFPNRGESSAVWAGNQLIVWGGLSDSGELLNDGASLSPDESSATGTSSP